MAGELKRITDGRTRTRGASDIETCESEHTTGVVHALAALSRPDTQWWQYRKSAIAMYGYTCDSALHMVRIEGD